MVVYTTIYISRDIAFEKIEHIPSITLNSYKMPRNTQPSRRTKTAISKNTARLEEVSKNQDVLFGRVSRNLGGRQMLVTNHEHQDVLAYIPGTLAHRSATPIRSGDLVVLLPREYEVRSAGKMRYDIFAVVHERKQIREHIRKGIIPSWMLEQSADSTNKYEADIEFDYDLDENINENITNIDNSDDDNNDINIDEI